MTTTAPTIVDVVAPTAQPSDLSDNERKVLASLREGHRSLNALSGRTGLRKLHITRIVHALASRGCITFGDET